MATIRPKLTHSQFIAVHQDARSAVGFIQHGVIALVALDGANDFRQLPMQLLAIGFERFFETTIGLAEFERDGVWPDDLKKRYGHNLQKLAGGLVPLMKADVAYGQRYAPDVQFLATDPQLDLIFRALTIYGEAGRYYNLELIRGAAKLPGDPERAWSDIENACLDEMPQWKARIGTTEFGGFYVDMAERLTATVQRCARAVSRMWTLGPFGRPGKELTGTVLPFLGLTDGELSTPTKLS